MAFDLVAVEELKYKTSVSLCNASLLSMVLALIVPLQAIATQPSPPPGDQHFTTGESGVAAELQAFFEEGWKLCVGPGSLSSMGWPELEYFCAELQHTAPPAAAECSRTTLADDIPGADVILIGETIELDQALTRRIQKLEGGISGEAWAIRPIDRLKGQVPSPRIRVWSAFVAGQFFHRAERYLLLLKPIKNVSDGVYGTYSTGCNMHSRPLAQKPLTKAEREQIAFLQGPQYRQTRLAALCGSASRQADLFVSGTKFPQQNMVTLLEAASRLCGFTWCNPQYCH